MAVLEKVRNKEKTISFLNIGENLNLSDKRIIKRKKPARVLA